MLLVLLYHAKLGVRGGYLGVDVFFVISGFLMTGLVASGIERGDFTFVGFYFRRAKRLLPAAYATFFATALLAPVFLTWSSLIPFAKEMTGAVTFTANIVMWRQTGYFDGASALKPLLHVWSLSLEEQYYFLLPATLVFVPRRYWMKAASGLLVLSGVACAIATVRNPAAAFYWLPFRAWELGLGSLGALLVRRDPDRLRRVARPLVWPAVLLLLVAIPNSPRQPAFTPARTRYSFASPRSRSSRATALSSWQNAPARALAMGRRPFLFVVPGPLADPSPSRRTPGWGRVTSCRSRSALAASCSALGARCRIVPLGGASQRGDTTVRLSSPARRSD